MGSIFPSITIESPCSGPLSSGSAAVATGGSSLGGAPGSLARASSIVMTAIGWVLLPSGCATCAIEGNRSVRLSPLGPWIAAGL